ncbi:MAG: endonuclease III [Patescibacteria group bacterium]
MQSLEFQRKKQKTLIAVRALAKLYPQAKVFLSHRNPWELLVATILSAQCTDAMVNKVTKKLFKKYRTFNGYLKADQKQFAQDIHSTGFYRQKTKHILAAAHLIQTKFHGRVPHTMDELLTLPGVGRKTANIVLQNAFGIVVGIPVDTHVRRLSRLLGLTRNTDPDKIEQDLIRLLPKKEWVLLSYRLIAYGREFCPSRAHDHSKCPLNSPPMASPYLDDKKGEIERGCVIQHPLYTIPSPHLTKKGTLKGQNSRTNKSSQVLPFTPHIFLIPPQSYLWESFHHHE